MKFMMLMIPAVYQGENAPAADANFMPDQEAMDRMGKFNQELADAGALVDLTGLHPLSRGARVSYSAEGPSLTDGPFIEAKEVVGGYWVIDVPSKEKAVEWAMKIPADAGDVVEIRPFFEFEE